MSDKMSQDAIGALLGGTANKSGLTDIELDALGEVMNISMGSAATAMSTMLRMQVNITTPRVEVVNVDDFVCTSLEPAIGVEISYVEGIQGSNIFILSQEDIKKIVDILLGGDGTNIDSEFGEMHFSAVGEVMNQMMGSSSTALADFFGTPVNISTPKTYNIEGNYKVTGQTFTSGEPLVSVTFDFTVGAVIKSEMISTLTMNCAEEMIGLAMKAMGISSPHDVQPEPPLPPPPANAEQYTPAPQAPPAQEIPQPKPQYPPDNLPYPQPQQVPQYAPSPPPNAYSPSVNVSPASFHSFDSVEEPHMQTPGNLDLILDLPLEITVEIGRAKKQVKEILDIGQGSIIELDKQAADMVDVIVNGHMIAKGSVVVIDESFAVRITEIVSPKDRIKSAGK